MGGRPNENFSAAARLGLTFGLGAWLGAPGYIAGGVLGSVLFPPDAPEAPDPYTALNLNTSEEGAGVPLHYGVNKIKGNWIYKGPLRKKKVEQGGKGGQKTVTGYKYWTWAALGLGRGILDVTRMWKNDDIIVPEADSALTLYRGTPEQTIDPDWDLRADDVVPLKRIAYTYFNNWYLGEDNASMPTISSEAHNLPWDTELNDVAPYVLNKVSEQTLGGDCILRDKYDQIITITSDEMNVYDKNWELQRTVDLTPLALSFSFQWDACLTYSKSKTYVNIIVGNDVDGEIQLIKFSKTVSNVNTEQTDLQRGKYTRTTIYTPSGSSNFEGIEVAVTKDYIFIAEDNQYSPFNNLHKVNYAGTTLLATYDMSLIDNANDITANEDFIFWQGSAGTLYMIDFTGNVLDSTTWPLAMSTPNCIVALYGSECILGVDMGFSPGAPDPDYDKIGYLTYDREAQTFYSNTADVIEVNNEWWNSPTGSPFAGMPGYVGSVCEGPNGTLYYTGYDTLSNYHTMEMIIDANPGHIIFDLFKNTRGLDTSIVDTAQLESVALTCFENRIGMSFSVLRKRNVGAVIRDVLGHLQAHPYQTDAGKFGFFMPNVNDPLADPDPITAEDVVSITDLGTPDLAIISTSMKDIGLCPNRLNVIYTNRLNGYKRDATFQLDDMLSQDLDGEVIEENLNYNMFSNPAVISKLAWKAWKIGRFQNAIHTTVLNSRWLKIRHGQSYLLNFPEDNINNQRCRVFSIQDPPADVGAGVTVSWIIDEDYIVGYENINYDPSISEETDVGQPEEVIPVVWEEDARYNNDVPHLGLTAIRSGENTTYADVYASLDAPDNFFYVTRLTQFANVGDLVADVGKYDRRFTVNTDAYPESTFVSYTRTNQRNNLSYCLVGKVPTDFSCTLEDLEFVTYREAVASGSDIQLRNMVREKDYTFYKPHTVADNTVVLHTGITYNKVEIPTEWMGKTVYFKFAPFNLRGDGPEDLAEVDTYEYTFSNWTRKATHADRLQIEDSTRGILGRRTKTADLDVKVVWEYTNRNSGMGAAALDAWEWQGWQPGDVDDYDIIIYDSDGTTIIAEHLGIGLVDNYTYTDAQNAIDFGGLASNHYWLGVRPVVTGRGPGREGFDIIKQEIERV